MTRYTFIDSFVRLIDAQYIPRNELAARLGLKTAGAVSNTLKRTRNLSTKTMQKYAKAAGITIAVTKKGERAPKQSGLVDGFISLIKAEMVAQHVNADVLALRLGREVTSVLNGPTSISSSKMVALATAMGFEIEIIYTGRIATQPVTPCLISADRPTQPHRVTNHKKVILDALEANGITEADLDRLTGMNVTKLLNGQYLKADVMMDVARAIGLEIEIRGNWVVPLDTSVKAN